MRKVIAPLLAVAALGTVLLVSSGASATEGCIIPITDEGSCTYNPDQDGTYIAASDGWSIHIVHADTSTTDYSSALGSPPVGIDVIVASDTSVTATLTGSGVLAVGNAAP
jgi:hypothetical protein